jgi:epoxyqueuosine reductase QueG
LYGCVSCQEACIHNKRPIRGVQTSEGALPAYIDVLRLLKLSDTEIKALFSGTAMGLSWLGPKAIRRNALAVLGEAGE